MKLDSCSVEELVVLEVGGQAMRRAGQFWAAQGRPLGTLASSALARSSEAIVAKLVHDACLTNPDADLEKMVEQATTALIKVASEMFGPASVSGVN